MLTEVTACCTCLRKSNAKRMASNLLITLQLLCLVQTIYSIPDYTNVHEQLSIRENQQKSNHKKQDKSTIVIRAGKVFRMSLNDFTFKNRKDEVATVQLTEHGKNRLPQWLTYHAAKNKLVGLPTRKDIGKTTIILKTGIKGLKKTVKFDFDIREMKQHFHCRDGSPSLVAAAVLNTNINNFDGQTRVKLLRKFSDYIEVEMHDLAMAEKESDTLFDSSVVTAGPGDKLQTDKSAIVITWKVKCGLGLAGDITVNKLKHSSDNKLIYNAVGVPFIGWYVFKSHNRFRRQAFPAATPVPTPAASVPIPKSVSSVISGTPVISPTPSIVVKSTSSVAPVIPTSVTTGGVIKPTPVVTTKVPTTTQPLTTKPETTKKTSTKAPTTEMKTSTTEKPKIITKKPTVKTTMKPTEKKTMKTTEKTTMKPTEGTTKPVETTMKPDTTKPDMTTKPEMTTKPKMTTKTSPIVTVKPMTTKKDEGPELKNPIDRIDLFANQAFKLKIQRDMFNDNDGDTYSLQLALKRVVSQKLIDVDESWIYLDTNEKYLYVLPNLSHVGDNLFAIQATDSSGNTENAVFKVKVTDENIIFNNFFNVTIEADFVSFTRNVKNKVNLVERIALATEVGYKTLRTQRFYPGSVKINYACEALRRDDCNNVDAQNYKAKLSGAEFKNNMAPDFIVEGTASETVSPNCPNGNPIEAKRATNKDEYKWWEVVLIPVIVIAVLLLVIGLIFFFLYRRKRRYEPQKQDKNTFLYQKKPVIFREEYEEKPDVISLEPLILPNEKAPLTNSAYQPRTSTPDANASSSNSTDGDEKALIEKSTPPQTPQAQSPPRSPPYGRSPPPYTEPE